MPIAAMRFFIPRRHLLTILAVAIIATLPALILGSGGTDLRCQSLWVQFFSQQLWGGEVYPRWLPTLFAGAGAPVFFYYPPLAYYLTSLFYPLSSLDPFGYAQIAASGFCAILLSGVTFYRWADKKNPLIGSLIYMTAPVLLALDFYYGVLLSAMWAYAFFPLLMISCKRLLEGKSFAVTTLAISLSLIVLTNIPAAIMMLTLAIAYCFSQGALRSFAVIRNGILSGLAALALCAAYLLPAYAYQKFTNLDWHWQEFYFWTDLKDPSLTYTYFTLWGISLLLLTFWYKGTALSSRRFFLVSGIITLLVMLPLGRALWEQLMYFKLIQMQERLFAIIAFVLATLVASTHYKKLPIIIIIASLALAFSAAHHTRMDMGGFAQHRKNAYEMHQLNIDQYANYLPNPWAMQFFATPGGREKLSRDNDLVKLIEGDASLKLLQQKPREIVFSYDASQPSTIRIRQHIYPGFVAYFNNEELPVEIDEERALLLIHTPAGHGTLRIQLTRLLPETLGYLLGMIGTATLLITWLIRRNQSRM